MSETTPIESPPGNGDPITKSELEYYQTLPTGLQPYPTTPTETFLKLERLGYFRLIIIKTTNSKYYQKIK